jgi:hypothetical protein
MTIGAAIDVRTFDANVVRVRAAVAPPFGRTENADNRRAAAIARCVGPGVAADVNFSAFRQFVKSFQARLPPLNFAGFAVSQNFFRQFPFVRRGRNNRNQTVFFPKPIRQRAEFFRVPEFRRPAARRIQNREIFAGFD